MLSKEDGIDRWEYCQAVENANTLAHAYVSRPHVFAFSSHVSVATMTTLDEECDISDEEVSKACMEYDEKMESLQKLVTEYAPKMNDVKELVSEMRDIKMTVSKSAPAADSPQLRAALESAKATEAEFGAGSDEAKVAWESVEEIASSGLSNSMGTRLDQECLVETAIEACEALDELNRALNLQKTKDDAALNS